MDRPALRPPFAYFGGKTLLAEQIAGLLPAHEHYVEPFAGSLAVLLAKPRSERETVNDLDGDLVAFWRVLRDRPVDLERVATLTPHARDEFATSRDLDMVDDLERARRVWVRLTQSRSHSMKPTGWKFARGNAGFNPSRSLATFAGRIGPSAERLRGVSLESRDALDVIRDYGSEPTVCIYADPPYVGSTRATNYGLEMTADDQHQAFAQACHDARAAVVISGYGSALYDDLFGDWHRLELRGAVTLSGDNDRVEVLWSNRPIGEPDLFSFGEVS